MTENIDLLDVQEGDGWDKMKREQFTHLKIITGRVLTQGEDVSGNAGSQLASIALCFGRFGETARDLFMQVAALAEDHDEQKAKELFEWAVKKSTLKTIRTFIKICKGKGIDTTFAHEGEPNPADYLPEGADPESANDVTEYGFFAFHNAYYKMQSNGSGGYSYKAFTNFVMKVKFHIADKKHPRRIVELRNVFGKHITVDVQTHMLGSLQKFIDFCEGLGNFHFDGTGVDLKRLKRKLFTEEKDCAQIETLGWHHAGKFWAWSNGIYNCTFRPVDDDGIVEMEKANYYIPAGNTAYAQDPFTYTNEKKFRHFHREVDFTLWAEKYHQIFGNHGMVALCFGISCLFSDIVFQTMNGFPILFLYGEGSSGKGELAKKTQMLCGIPQDPLKLSEKANTDKAKIREMAQFINGIVCLEEYTNELDMKVINTLKGIWDRFGYKRAIMDSKFGNESVPINSGIFMTGNEYPVDDALLQRLVVIEMNENQFTAEAKEKYHSFTKWLDDGITNVTHQLLTHRKLFEEKYRETFHVQYKEMAASIALEGMDITDRMINNVAAIATTYTLLEPHFKFPFLGSDLKIYLKLLLRKQCEKRNTGGVVQQWWDIMLHLVNTRKIRIGREFTIDGDKLNIRFKEIYQLYAMQMTMTRSSPLKQSTLLDKLKLSAAWDGAKDSVRFDDRKTSCYQFKYHQCGIELWPAIHYLNKEEEERRMRTGAPVETPAEEPVPEDATPF